MTPAQKLHGRGADTRLPDVDLAADPSVSSVTTDDLAVDERLIVDEEGVLGALKGMVRRLAQGELGILPVLVAIVAIWTIFQLLNSRFLSPVNLTNLALQIAAVGTISIGVVLVLLLGEIDLSVGSVSGLAAAVMAVLNVKSGWPGWLAIATALVVGLVIGLIQGAWTTKLRVPSFVVTLAGLLAWQGALLYVLGSTGTINLADHTIVDLTGTFYGPGVSWALAFVVIAAYAGTHLLTWSRRSAEGLQVEPVLFLIVRIVAVIVVVLATTVTFLRDRGVPVAAVILVGFVVFFDVLTRRTRWGRHVFAVGGNTEAARRAGIRVDGIRIAVFAICSTMAAVGGVLAASRLLAVNQSSGGNDLLLNAIAAAVIGGTSLFGGRGSAWSALFGAIVIGSISNGMDLLAVQSSVKYMVTGAVLLFAVTIDALSRRGRLSSGRA